LQCFLSFPVDAINLVVIITAVVVLLDRILRQRSLGAHGGAQTRRNRVKIIKLPRFWDEILYFFTLFLDAFEFK